MTRIFGSRAAASAITGALNRAGDDAPEFVQVRHEEMAAFMACAHAKLTGEVGVCMATSGPGAIHLLNGLYDAKLDHAPVLAIVGQQARSAMGGSYQQGQPRVALQDVASTSTCTWRWSLPDAAPSSTARLHISAVSGR
ncbi:MAG: thiamine pyrophosphate-binding protein [Polyangiales bacterium]